LNDPHVLHLAEKLGRTTAMSIWQKLAAAVSIGAVMGPRFGGEEAYDSPVKRDLPVDDALPFTVGMIMLGAKMAKADGVVTKDEVRAFKKAFKVSDAEMRDAARVFNLARQDTTGSKRAPRNSSPSLRVIERFSSTSSKVCSTSPKRMGCCTLRNKSSSGRWLSA
jgi:Tellurite resistance protein TerB